MISNKILLNNIPIFNNFSLVEDGISINPFVHFNLLWTPDFKKDVIKMTPSEIETKATRENMNNNANANITHADSSDSYNPLHLSAGFGVSLITGAFALELYYNAYLKKNSHDVGKEFSIKFGLD
jgi:hypothetical protein